MHPAFSLHLAPGNYRLFRFMANNLVREEKKTMGTDCSNFFPNRNKDFFESGFMKLH